MVYSNRCKKFTSLSGISEVEISKEAYDREKKIKIFKMIRAEGCSIEAALRAIGVAQATLYRWRKAYRNGGLLMLENDDRAPHRRREAVKQKKYEKLVYAIRKKYKVYGKDRIKQILLREHNVNISEWTVGQILLKLLKRSAIRPVSFYTGHRIRKRRNFKGHAQRSSFENKPKKPGEFVQFDHTTIEHKGKIFKQFAAVCPTTRMLKTELYTEASSATAADFLQKVQDYFTFPISSIQVDGGSEFMKTFELKCQEKGIPLHVLPPRSPKLNAYVERSNGAVKDEFYSLITGEWSLKRLRRTLRGFTDYYNSKRPHQGLQYKSPLEYLNEIGVQKFSYVTN